MKQVETTTILCISAISEGDHDLAREQLDKLSHAELREVIAYSMMLNYLANETIDDKPRDLEGEAQRSRFRLEEPQDLGAGCRSPQGAGGGGKPQ